MSGIRLFLAILCGFAALAALHVPPASAGDWTAVEVHVAGAGSVTGTGGLACPDDHGNPNVCSKAYDLGDVVNLTADPDPGAPLPGPALTGCWLGSPGDPGGA